MKTSIKDEENIHGLTHTCTKHQSINLLFYHFLHFYKFAPIQLIINLIKIRSTHSPLFFFVAVWHLNMTHSDLEMLDLPHIDDDKEKAAEQISRSNFN